MSISSDTHPNVENKLLTLAPYVSWGWIGADLYVCGGTKQQVIPGTLPPTLTAAAVGVLESLRSGGLSKAQLTNALRNTDGTETEKRDVIGILTSAHLTMTEDRDPSDRYDRPKLYYNYAGGNPSETQERISAAHVAIIGCGGIGNILSSALVSSGIGYITLIDCDTIEESNLTRQIMFREADVGLPKIDVLARELRNLNSVTEVRVIHADITDEDVLAEALPHCDFAALSADSPPQIIEWLDRIALRRGLPYLPVGYVCDMPVIGPMVVPALGSPGWNSGSSFIAKQSSTEHVDRSEHAPPAPKAKTQAPSHAWTNLVASGLAVDDILCYLGGFATPVSLNRRIGLNKTGLYFETQQFD
ncbi:MULTISPECIES: ThiF family adenylyltransferase [Dietzia]|nr:hypothetical protein C3V38_13505 [Dietzia sp. oral taxon 368]